MADTSIKYLKDENGNIISPVVNIKSIFDDKGTSLLDIIYPVGSILEHYLEVLGQLGEQVEYLLE